MSEQRNITLGNNPFSQGVEHLRKRVLEGLKITSRADLDTIQDIARPEDAVPRLERRDFSSLIPEDISEHLEVTEKHELEAWWRKRFNDADRNFADLEGHRLVVGWRITREIAIAIGICHPDEMLTEAILRRDDPRCVWSSYTGRAPRVHGNPGWSDAVGMRMSQAGLGLGIPDISPEHLNAMGYIDPQYNPEKDDRLLAWIELVEFISRKMGIEAGSYRLPELGKMGLHGVLEPKMSRLLWPSRFALGSFEESLTIEALEQMQQSGGSRGTRKYLREKYGFLPGECTAVISAASREAIRQTGSEDTVQARAMLVLRLEEMMERARDAVDIKSELAALRLLATVQGITRSDPEDTAAAFVKAIDNVSKRPKVSVMDADTV